MKHELLSEKSQTEDIVSQEAGLGLDHILLYRITIRVNKDENKDMKQRNKMRWKRQEEDERLKVNQEVDRNC